MRRRSTGQTLVMWSLNLPVRLVVWSLEERTLLTNGPLLPLSMHSFPLRLIGMMLLTRSLLSLVDLSVVPIVPLTLCYTRLGPILWKLGCCLTVLAGNDEMDSRWLLRLMTTIPAPALLPLTARKRPAVPATTTFHRTRVDDTVVV